MFKNFGEFKEWLIDSITNGTATIINWGQENPGKAALILAAAGSTVGYAVGRSGKGDLKDENKQLKSENQKLKANNAEIALYAAQKEGEVINANYIIQGQKSNENMYGYRLGKLAADNERLQRELNEKK